MYAALTFTVLYPQAHANRYVKWLKYTYVSNNCFAKIYCTAGIGVRQRTQQPFICLKSKIFTKFSQSIIY